MVNYITGRRRAAQKSVCPELHNADLEKEQLSCRGGLLESEPIGGELGGRYTREQMSGVIGWKKKTVVAHKTRR